MDGELRCQRCSVALTGQAIGDLCANCLLKLALDPPHEETMGLDEAPPVPAGAIRVRYFGDYELMEEIARGGMGVVYKARQVSLNRTVALKMILAGDFSSPATIERFQTEAEAAARLEHPHIVPIYEIGTHESQHYFSMRFVEGGTLTQAIRREKFTPRRAAEQMIKVARAVHHAHQRGILHRDLKPGNILLDAAGEPHVADFGLAKLLEHDSALTQSAVVLGTPSYMAPEQAEGRMKEATTAVDIYSLGAIFYELLTGRPPFTGASALDVLTQVREREPASPQSLKPELDRDLAVICLKCLEKDPAHRYGSAEALAEELQRWLADEPIQARRTTLPERAWKWARRKPVVASLLVAILLVGVAGLVGILWQGKRAKEEAGRATAEAQRANLEAGNARQESKRAEAGELAARRVAYTSDMNLAQQALAQNNLGSAEELLNRHRPKEGRPDLRGWEWRYLWQYCRSDALFTLCKEGIIASLTLSHDGKWVAVGGYDNGELAVWDLDSRKEIVRLPGNGRRVVAAFSPRDRQLAFSGWTGSKSNAHHRVRLWDGNERKVVAELALAGECRGLAYSADGETLITATESPGEIVRWRIADQRKLATLPLRDALLSPEGTTFAVTRDFSMASYCAREGDITVVDLANGKELWTQRATEDRVLALAFSPDGKTLASAAGYVDPDMRLWDVPTGKEVGRQEKHRGWVGSIVFWPDGKTFASAGSDQLIRLWNMTETRPAAILRGHRLEVWRLAMLPDGRTLVSGSKDGSVCVWDTSKMGDRKTYTTVPGVFVWGFGDNGSSVVTLDRQGSVARWKGSGFRDSEPLFQVLPGFLEACISQDGNRVATVFSNGLVRVWDVKRRELTSEFVAGRISQSGEIGMNGTRRLQFLARTSSLVLSYQADDLLHQWDWESRREVRSWPAAPRAFAMGFSPDENWCLTVGWDGFGSLVNLREGRERHFDFGLKQLPDAAFSPDGKHFAVPSQTGVASVRETSSLGEVATLRGFMQGVHSVAFSADGRRLVTGSDGQEAIKFWDTKTWQELITLEGQGSIFRTPTFSADGDSLGALNSKGVLHLWHAPSWAEIETVGENAKPTR